MKAVIRLDVPDWQIGQEVAVYFPDTMRKHGVCEKDEIIMCKDCKHWVKDPGSKYGECIIRQTMSTWFCAVGDWFCVDGERRAEE